MRTGWFASFRMLVLGLVGIGALLFWQISMADVAGSELEGITGSDTTNLAVLLPFFIYFIGIFVMTGVFFSTLVSGAEVVEENKNSRYLKMVCRF